MRLIRFALMLAIAAASTAALASPAFAYRDVRFMFVNQSGVPLTVEWWHKADSSETAPRSMRIAPGGVDYATGSIDVLSRWDLVGRVGRSWGVPMNGHPEPWAYETRSSTICFAGRNPSFGAPRVAFGDAAIPDTETGGFTPFHRCSATPAGRAIDTTLTGNERRPKRVSINGVSGTVQRRPDTDAFIEFRFDVSEVPGIPTRRVTTAVNDPAMGRVVSVGRAAIDCGTRCTTVVREDEVVHLRAIPAPGYQVERWGEPWCRFERSDDCAFPPGRYSRDTTQPVTFRPIPALDLTVNTRGAGSGIVQSDPAQVECGPLSTCTGSFPTGATVTLRAFPDDRSGFAGWTGPCVGAGDTCTVTMDEARAVEATFTTAPSDPNPGGSPTPGGPEGPAPALLVVPEPGPNPPDPGAAVRRPGGSPGLSDVSVSRRSFVPWQGTVIRYRLAHDAVVSMTFTHERDRRPRYRYTAPSGAIGGNAGANAVRIVGRVGNRAVQRGRWTARITARNESGTTRTVTRTVRVQ